MVSQEEMMNTNRFLSGLFLGLVPILAIPLLFKKKQPNDFNYVETKINKIFDKNFSSEIRSPYERLRTIEYEFLDYEIAAYIDIAIEISKIKQELFYQLQPIAFSIIGITIASITSLQLANVNPKFSNGFIIGLVCYILIVIYIISDNFKKWKMMYYDLMLIKSNRPAHPPPQIPACTNSPPHSH